MAAIAQTTSGSNATATVTETELTGTDTLTYTGAGQILVIRNATGVQQTVNLLGDGVTETAKPCEGGGTIDLTTGFDVVVAAGAVESVRLSSIRDYINIGTVDVTGGVASVYAYIIV